MSLNFLTTDIHSQKQSWICSLKIAVRLIRDKLHYLIEFLIEFLFLEFLYFGKVTQSKQIKLTHINGKW